MGQDSIQTSQEDTLDILASMLPQGPVEKPLVSLFTEHSLQPINGLNPVELATFPGEFVIVILTLCATLIVYLQRNSDGIFSSVFKGSFDINLALQESRVENSQRIRNIILLQLISALAISLFVSGVIALLADVPKPFHEIYFQVLGGLVGFAVTKKGVQWLLSSLFQLSGVLKSYHFNTNILMAASALVLLPVCILMFFSPQIPSMALVYVSIVLVAFFYLKTIQRGLRIALATSSVSPLHLFYYFCALEILPVFVLIRLVLDM